MKTEGLPTTLPFPILERLRSGAGLSEADLRAVVAGAADGSWGDAQLGAFLMGVALSGLDDHSTGVLTRSMTASGDRWDLAREVPTLGDKHSTGGVGDKVSLVLGPLLAACDRPVAMLTGRGLGHTGGTADKLDTIPGLSQSLERADALDLLSSVGLALGVATRAIAPADRRLYHLRDVTATIRSIPLVVSSILSKKLALGAAGLVLDVKTGEGAFFRDPREARALARHLVATATELELPTAALVTDMSQPLGRWAGHTAEVRETLECLEGDGPEDLMEVTLALAETLAALTGTPLERAELEEAIASGRARERFDRWAEAQGADPAWLARPDLALAPEEIALTAPRGGIVTRMETEQLGLLLAEAGGGRIQPQDEIDPGVSLATEVRLGDEVEEGDLLARLYLRRPDEGLAQRARGCFHVTAGGEAGGYEPPPLVYERVGVGE